MSEENPPVTLTRYEWHKLLSQMEYLMRFANIEQTINKALYVRISSQLHGSPVEIKEV